MKRTDLKGFAASMRGPAQVQIKGALLAAMHEAGDLLAGPIIQETIDATEPVPVDMAQYRASWSNKTTGKGSMVASSAKQAVWIERGRGPGPVPLEAIKAWAARKGIAPEVAFLIARKIARTGYAPRFVLRRAIESLRPRFGAIVKSYLGTVTG